MLLDVVFDVLFRLGRWTAARAAQNNATPAAFRSTSGFENESSYAPASDASDASDSSSSSSNRPDRQIHDLALVDFALVRRVVVIATTATAADVLAVAFEKPLSCWKAK